MLAKVAELLQPGPRDRRAGFEAVPIDEAEKDTGEHMMHPSPPPSQSLLLPSTWRAPADWRTARWGLAHDQESMRLQRHIAGVVSAPGLTAITLCVARR